VAWKTMRSRAAGLDGVHVNRATRLLFAWRAWWWADAADGTTARKTAAVNAAKEGVRTFGFLSRSGRPAKQCQDRPLPGYRTGVGRSVVPLKRR
jgi:hypothetical protein